MKRTKLILHIWITLASALSFLGGWAIFSHSPKPAVLLPSLNNTTQAQGPAGLAPIPSLDSLIASSSKAQSTGLQPLPALSLSANSSTFTLRTRGS